MGKKINNFATGELYHVFNRGVDKRIIFEDEQDMQRFFKSLIEFNVVDPIGSLYENSFRENWGVTPKLWERLVYFFGFFVYTKHLDFII